MSDTPTPAALACRRFTPGSRYPRTVAAATATPPTRTALAEALALDIPARPKRGPRPGQFPITEELEAARWAATAAGGRQVPAAPTLALYRQVALWVAGRGGASFRWITGRSFNTHRDAYLAGFSYEGFASSPATTVALVREHAARLGYHGRSTAARRTPAPAATG